MGSRKTAFSYYFSVEGETEKWYLEHLQNLINSAEKAAYAVKFIIKVQKDPREMVKAYAPIDKITINHLCDTESNDPQHTQLFRKTLENMKAACTMGKKIFYRLGYCNFAFDLWIVLHKVDCYGPLADRRQYLGYLNKGFMQQFTSMDDYKKEAHFRRCLQAITLDDVFTAIQRAEKIMADSQANGQPFITYKKYLYCTENPSLSVHEIITDILKQCRLM